jgi:hypothetical protein
MPVSRAVADGQFNIDATLPYELRLKDFELAMQDAYDLLFDINSALSSRGLRRIEETIRPAVFSGFLSDTIASALARHARVLTSNAFHNGHPDLIPEGVYPLDAVPAGNEGVEIKVTGGGGGVDTHGARDAWLCLFRYRSDVKSEPANSRAATVFTEILLGRLGLADFRSNERGLLGTRTASPNKEGLTKLRANWVYRAS